MRRITLWLLSTVTALVLLFSYRTSTSGGAGPDTAVVTGAAPRATATGSAGSASTPDGGSASTADGGSGDAAGSGSYDGSVVQTRWGPVQVRITVSNGKITDVEAVKYPNSSHHDQQINAYALPILRERVLQAQSADIDTVSGATNTSDGYLESLQAAIDAAHLR